MSKRMSLVDLQAELMLRKMLFRSSTKVAKERRTSSIAVNCSGGLARDNVALQRLAEKGLIKIEREPRRWRSFVRKTLATLTVRAPDRPEETCPCCNESFVQLDRHTGTYWVEWQSYHRPECQLNLNPEYR